MNKIIVMFKDKDKELSISIYDFIDELYRYVLPTIICHVTPEEYEKMISQINSSGLLNEHLYKDTNLIGYDPSRYLITFNDYEHHILISDYNHPQKIGNYIIEDGILSYNEYGYQINNHPSISKSLTWKYKVYTTETYDDIIKHYSK